MAIAESKITRQGQITVPSAIRRRLGLAPGSILEWSEQDGEIVIRRAAKHSSLAIHQSLFSTPPSSKTHDQLKEGIRERMRRRYARD